MRKHTHKLLIFVVVICIFALPLLSTVKADNITTVYSGIIEWDAGKIVYVQDVSNVIDIGVSVVDGDLNATLSVTLSSVGGTIIITPSTSGHLEVVYVPNVPLAFIIKVNNNAYTGIFAFNSGFSYVISWVYPYVGPTTPPYFPNSINTDYLWQYLNNYDFIGFLIACWTVDLGESFYVIISMIVTLALYIRLKNLTVMTIMWFLLGGIWVALIPFTSPIILLLFILGIGALLFKLYGESKY